MQTMAQHMTNTVHARGVTHQSQQCASGNRVPVVAHHRSQPPSSRVVTSAFFGKQGALQACTARPSSSNVDKLSSFSVCVAAVDSSASPEVALESECGHDYTSLKEALASGDFQEADNITRATLIELAGEEADIRGWVYFTEVPEIPVKDLQTIDALWSAYSDGKFGFTVQRQIWGKQKQRWAKFFQAIDWTYGENATYRKWPKEYHYTLEEACAGHLPLTNALRGTQLLEGLLLHEAFGGKEITGGKGKGKLPGLNMPASAPTTGVKGGVVKPGGGKPMGRDLTTLF